MFNTYTFEVENWKKKRIQIDRGGEVVSHWFSCYCEENAIVHQTSVPYTKKKKKCFDRKKEKRKTGHCLTWAMQCLWMQSC